MDELFNEYWKENKGQLEKMGTVEMTAKLAFIQGHNLGYEAARKTTLRAITKNRKSK